MSSVLLYSFEDNEIKINNRYISDIDFDSFQNYEESNNFTNGHYISDHNVRKSYIHKLNHKCIIKDFDKICGKIGIKGMNFHTDGWSLLKYEKGCKFEDHIDSIGEYTMLLFPSNKINNIEGGELVITSYDLITKEINDKKTIIEPNKLEKTTLVIIKADTIHRVNEVIEGTRYVYKNSFNKTSKSPEFNFGHTQNHHIYDSSFHRKNKKHECCTIS